MSQNEFRKVDDFTSQVTLEQMKNLSSYGSVFVDSHGTLKGIFSHQPYMLIGEQLNEDKFLWDPGYYLQHVQYSSDYLSGRIYCTGKDDRVAIGGNFFEKYYSNNSLSDSFWFLGTCYSMYDNSIASALINKGAGAVVGYTNSVSVPYCNNTLFETVINSMILSSDSVGNGISESKQIYGNVDPNNSKTELKMKGKVNYKLVNNVSANEICVVFHEGFRNGRLEMSRVYAPNNAKVIWNKNLTVDNQNGNVDQYYYDGSE